MVPVSTNGETVIHRLEECLLVHAGEPLIEEVTREA